MDFRERLLFVRPGTPGDEIKFDPTNNEQEDERLEEQPATSSESRALKASSRAAVQTRKGKEEEAKVHRL